MDRLLGNFYNFYFYMGKNKYNFSVYVLSKRLSLKLSTFRTKQHIRVSDFSDLYVEARHRVAPVPH